MQNETSTEEKNGTSEVLERSVSFTTNGFDLSNFYR